jgi:hypothetical protein
VDLSADPSAIRALDLAHYDNVAFSRDQIFVRVFED